MNKNTTSKPFNIWPEQKTGKWIVSRTQPGINNEVVFAECWTQEHANLISQAPAMLEALKAIVETHDNLGTFTPVHWRTARQVIAKAEGKE